MWFIGPGPEKKMYTALFHIFKAEIPNFKINKIMIILQKYYAISIQLVYMICQCKVVPIANCYKEKMV